MDIPEETERSAPGRAMALVVAVLAVVALAARYEVLRASEERRDGWIIAPGAMIRPNLAQSDARESAAARVLREGGKIDLNAASADDLRLLPRIGPRLAERIVADRAARGTYRRLEDLERVSGIGPRTIEQLRPLAFVRPAENATDDPDPQ